MAEHVNSPAGQRPAVRAEANESEGQLPGIAAEVRSRPRADRRGRPLSGALH